MSLYIVIGERFYYPSGGVHDWRCCTSNYGNARDIYDALVKTERHRGPDMVTLVEVKDGGWRIDRTWTRPDDR